MNRTRDRWHRPGKFEGEAAYVPYFWDQFLYGDANRVIVIAFYVTQEDQELFPELRSRITVKLYVDNQGFVTEV